MRIEYRDRIESMIGYSKKSISILKTSIAYENKVFYSCFVDDLLKFTYKLSFLKLT